MTTNQLIRELSGASWKLKTPDLPVRINNETVEILGVSLNDEENPQWCNIEIKYSTKDE